MKVVFRTNLGSDDAKRLNVDQKDHKKCLAGKSLEVEKDIGDQLIKEGLAVTPEDAKNDPLVQSALGVPDEPAVPDTSVAGLRKKFDDATPDELRAVAKKPEITAPAK